MPEPSLRSEPLDLVAERLAWLKASPDCIPYCENAQFGAKRGLQLSIYGAYPTREIFLEVTDGRHTRVKSFLSRLQDLPLESRRAEMPLVDVSDAFKFARTMTGNWPAYGARQMRAEG